MTKDEALKIALKTFEKIYEGCGYVIEDRIAKTTTALAEHVRKDCIEGMNVEPSLKYKLRELMGFKNI